MPEHYPADNSLLDGVVEVPQIKTVRGTELTHKRREESDGGIAMVERNHAA